MGSSVILPSPGQPTTGPDASFKSGSIPNLVSFAFRHVEPPSPLYVQRDDFLLLQAGTTAAGGDTVRFTLRELTAVPPLPGQPDNHPLDIGAAPIGPGDVKVGNFDIAAAINGQVTTTQKLIQLQEGYLLGVSASCLAASQRGTTFARASIVRQGAIIFTTLIPVVQQLFADYLTTDQMVGWPGGRVLAAVEGPGTNTGITVGNPAAGVDWVTGPAGVTRWRMESFNAQLAIANAGVARIVRVQIKDASAQLIWQSAAQQTGAINSTVQVSATTSQSNSAVDPTTLNIVIPPAAFLEGAWSIGVSTSNINAADQWSNIRLNFESWLNAI